MVEPVSETIHFPSEEERILQFWKDEDCFRECLNQSKNRPKYTFYDGPPFATGLPHYGHILAGTIKDIVTRFAHQSGFHVDRRFGWDCHGLPVEYEIDKMLNIKGPEDVAKMGIAEYNKQCRSIVMRYSTEWEVIMRMGRWIDFKHDYKTLYPWFMETVWWVFKQLYDKGLVYRGVKVMPFSTACNTPLSNFESHQNYKDVQDPSIIVNFPLLEDENVCLIAWTTTPWTLPSNLALCVNPELIYVKVKGYIRLPFSGADLTAAALCLFLQDDYRVCMEYDIIQRDSPPICPVDSSGCFTSEVTHFAGQYVKDADKNIIKWLKENGRLVSAGSFKHSYPFCWRSDTPLIYKAVPSWFVRVEHMVKKLLDNNAKCYWVPEFVREKRFGNWLRDARDWAISRNRYWGTPIPLWVSDDFEEVVCVGSMAELEELTGSKVTDLHRESIDQLTILSRCGKGKLKRVSEVFDCWFESGSMPYAQVHYPFENRRDFEDTFPADFIAEGIDQTRGWFYTLLVLSTALFGKPPFKNVIVNGLVLASDGQKMSKRKKNYPDPSLIVQNYGADALRLYLINSPVVRAENLRFKEEGVRDVLKDVFLPWYNAYRFLVQNVQRLHKEENIQFLYNESTAKLSGNIMDKWIQSFTQSLIQFFKVEMAAYRLYTVVPKLVKFVDMLTNWYVRTNRRRLKGESGMEDCVWALETLFSVLFSMCRLMNISLTHFILYVVLPASQTMMLSFIYREALIDSRIESAVSRMQSVIELGRVIRDRKTLPVKYPLREVVVIHQDSEALQDIQSLQKYIVEELNVRQLTLSTEKDKYGIRLRAEPDHVILGRRLKGAFKAVTASIKELRSEQLETFQRTGSIMVDGHELHEEDLRLMYTFDQTSGMGTQYEAHSDAQVLVLLDITPDQSMVDEGVAREVINRIQKLRKKGHLVPSDEIAVYYSSEPAGDYLDKVIQAHTDFILATTKAPLKPYPVPKNASIIVQERTQLKGSDLDLTIVRGVEICTAPLTGPVCAYVNLKVNLSNKQQEGMILLENPKGDNKLDLEKLKMVCRSIFRLNNGPLAVFSGTTELTGNSDLLALSGKTLLVNSGASPTEMNAPDALMCPYINLQLINASPAECHSGGMGTLLLANPVGQNGLHYPGLLTETAKMFGLRGRRLKVYMDEDFTEGISLWHVQKLIPPQLGGTECWKCTFHVVPSSASMVPL
uniref:Isoleucine--tRNA ligase, cytoplasmic n=1 Tax=Electrophorus electricus TaxID=8005 RepID=A0A4W4E0F7_ELEEL